MKADGNSYTVKIDYADSYSRFAKNREHTLLEDQFVPSSGQIRGQQTWDKITTPGGL